MDDFLGEWGALSDDASNVDVLTSSSVDAIEQSRKNERRILVIAGSDSSGGA